MNQAEFMVAMQQRGVGGTGNLFCGVYEGYPFSAIFKSGKSGGMLTYTLQMQFAETVPTKMYKDIRVSFKGRADLAAAVGRDRKLFSMTVVLRDGSTLTSLFDEILQAVIQQARQNGLLLPAVCPLCNSAGCDSFAFVQGSFRPVHRTCVDTLAIANQNAVEKNELQGSYLSGAVGALLGGIVGAIPNVFVIVFFDYILALLCALVPIGAYYGYKLFRGRMNNLSLVFIGIVTLLMVPVSQYMTTAVYGWKEAGLFISPALYIEVASQMGGEMLASWGQIFLFMALGFFISFGYVRRGNKDVLMDTGLITSTLRPMEQAPAAAPPPVPRNGGNGAPPQ